jgi:BirA family biotin operon repressor/biotin-[acetyl-CoA-carboxylase] ligase
MRLDSTAETAGVRLITYETIDSTNAEGLRLARAGERGPLWIVAKRQTAGRGRRGRGWVSEQGNLYASLLLTNSSPPEHAAQLSFVAVLALFDANTGRIPGLAVRLSVKWPNDLLIDRMKFAGILVESEGSAAVIGIGVNCTHHPAGTNFPATDLAAAGVRATPESLFGPLSAAMVSRLRQWDSGAGFPAVRADWLARAASLGGQIRVAMPEGERSGRFEGIDQRGCLVLRIADGTMQTIAAGDVLTGPRH